MSSARHSDSVGAIGRQERAAERAGSVSLGDPGGTWQDRRAKRPARAALRRDDPDRHVLHLRPGPARADQLASLTGHRRGHGDIGYDAGRGRE